MAEYVRVPKADWISILDAIRAKTGNSDKLLSGAVPSEIASIKIGGSYIHREVEHNVNISAGVSVTVSDYKE